MRFFTGILCLLAGIMFHPSPVTAQTGYPSQIEMLASLRSGNPQRVTHALGNITQDALAQALYANLYHVAGSEPSSQLEASAVAKALGFVLIVGLDDDMAPLAQQEFAGQVTRLEQLLRAIDPAVGNVVEEFQWKAVELMQFATAYDFYRAASGAASPEAERTLAAFADNATQQLRNGFVIRNNLSLKLAAAAGYAALILLDEEMHGTRFSPGQWLQTAMLHIESTLFEYQSSADGYFGYSEGPWYFRYAMQNLIPFFLALDARCDGGALLVEGREVRSPLHDPKYLRLFEWIATLRMPDGMLPPFEDTYRNAWFPEAATIASVQPDAAWMAWPNYEGAGCEIDHARLSTELSRNFDARVEYLLNEAATRHAAPSLPTSRLWPDAGYAVFRSDWNSDALYFALIGKHGIARTHRSPVGSGHKHANETAFILHVGGELLAMEPGYHSSGERGALVFGDQHNIVLVDGKGPDSTAWGTSLFGVDAFMADTLSCADAGMVAIRTAYQGADIERRAAVLGGKFIVLADRCSSTYPRDFTHQLHGNGLETLRSYTADFSRQRATWTRNAMSLHAVVATPAGAPEQTSVTRSHAPSGSQFAKHSAFYSKSRGSEAAFHTILSAARSTDAVEMTVLRQCDGLSALSVKHGSQEFLSLLNATGAAASASLPMLGMVRTDASAFHCVLDSAGRPDLWMLDGGSFIRSDDRVLLSSSQCLRAVAAFDGSIIRLSIRGSEPASLQLRIPFTVTSVTGDGIAEWDQTGNMLRLRLSLENTDLTIALTSVLAGVDDMQESTMSPQLHIPYPQPVHAGGVVTCTFTLPAHGEADLSLWDALGRRHSEKRIAVSESGTQSAMLETQGLRPGMYFIRLQAGAHTLVQRLLIR